MPQNNKILKKLQGKMSEFYFTLFYYCPDISYYFIIYNIIYYLMHTAVHVYKLLFYYYLFILCH